MVDSQGIGAQYKEGDRVWVAPLKMEATVIRQVLHWDYPDSFWGNLELLYDDGVKGTSNSWQCSKVVKVSAENDMLDSLRVGDARDL